MKKILVMLLICLPVSLVAQPLDSLHKSKYTVNAGIGWSHYINTIEIAKEYVHPDHISVTLRFFWEPGYRVSLGLATGYYRVYSFSVSDPRLDATVHLTAIPMLLVARMRVFNRIHLSAGTGVTLLKNSIRSDNSEVINNIWSLSTYEFTGSYVYPLNKRFRIAGEAGTIYIGKTNDWIYFVQGVISFIL